MIDCCADTPCSRIDACCDRDKSVAGQKKRNGTKKTKMGQNKQPVVGTKKNRHSGQHKKRQTGQTKQTRGTKKQHQCVVCVLLSCCCCVVVLLCVVCCVSCVVCCVLCVLPTFCRTAPPPDRPKFRFFFPPRHNFHSFLSLLGVLSLNFGGVLKAGTLKCARLGSRAVV